MQNESWVRTIAVFLTFILASSNAFSIPKTASPAGLSPETIQTLARKRFSTEAVGDRVVVITGATGGIGKELCRVFSEQLSARVVALDFDESALQQLREECTKGKAIQTIVADHSDLDSVAQAAQEILEEHNAIDLLVNNAGIWYPFDDTEVHRAGASAQGYDALFSINYLSAFLLTELLTPALCQSGDARMVHVVSTKHWQVDGSSLLPSATNSPAASRSGDRLPTHVEDSYANSKLAQVWHSRAWSRKTGVSAVCACPSWAATGIAGDHPNGDVLTRFAYSADDCGPAVTSVLNAMLRTNDQLETTATTQYVANSRVWTTLLPPLKGWWMTSKAVSQWRSSIVAFCTTLILLTQRWFHDDFILQETSPESSNQKAQEEFYEWSLEAVKPWLGTPAIETETIAVDDQAQAPLV